MPPPLKRMTQQPARPTRYYPGTAYAEEPVSDDEEDSEEEQKPAPKAPPPKATSFPASRKLATDIKRPSAAHPAAPKPPEDDLEGFVTASESSDDEKDAKNSSDGDHSEDGDEGDDSSEEEDSGSDDEPAQPMLAPKFLSKAKRAQQAPPPVDDAATAAAEEQKRQKQADAQLQAHITRTAAARAAGKKFWDDDDIAPEEGVDDTDNLDPEAERAAWKLRELKRVQRDRAALVEKEKEREEVDRRRKLSTAEREAEDREFIAAQNEEREGKGTMGFMQRYHHKGAFFAGDDAEQDEEVKAALNRSFAGARFEDDACDKAVLPEYMRIRDMTKLGRKGRTKYKDLRAEDTGQWGAAGGKKGEYAGLDERFRPDDRREGGKERTGANEAPLGERKRREDDDGRGEGKRARSTGHLVRAAFEDCWSGACTTVRNSSNAYASALHLHSNTALARRLSSAFLKWTSADADPHASTPAGLASTGFVAILRRTFRRVTGSKNLNHTPQITTMIAANTSASPSTGETSVCTLMGKWETSVCSIMKGETSVCAIMKGETSVCTIQKGETSVCTIQKGETSVCTIQKGETSVCSVM